MEAVVFRLSKLVSKISTMMLYHNHANLVKLDVFLALNQMNVNAVLVVLHVIMMVLYAVLVQKDMYLLVASAKQ